MMKGWLNPNVTPEKLLMDYVATGNKKYLALLVAQFNTAIFHYLLTLSDKEMAEDAIQTTWLKVIKNRNKNHTNVKSWLFTIARRTLIDELRAQKKWQWRPLSDEPVSTLNLPDFFDELDRVTQFNNAVSTLPFYQREVFIFQQEGFSVIEICQLTNENFETVKSRLRYARNNLKTMLGSTL